MEKYDIILEAGQSNADGYGHGPAESPYVPDPRVLYLTAGNPAACEYEPKGELEIKIAAERPDPSRPGDILGDLALGFARKYVSLLEPDRKLLIVRTAVGGTGFMKRYWAVGDPLYERMLRMMDHAMSLNPENRLVGLLWHQGEHEVAFENKPETYHQQLRDLVESVKERYHAPRLPFVCGGFCAEWAEKRQPACDRIQGVLRTVAQEMGGRYVETADLPSNNQKTGDGDDIHFCREALLELGQRYFEAFKEIK